MLRLFVMLLPALLFAAGNLSPVTVLQQNNSGDIINNSTPVKAGRGLGFTIRRSVPIRAGMSSRRGGIRSACPSLWLGIWNLVLGASRASRALGFRIWSLGFPAPSGRC